MSIAINPIFPVIGAQPATADVALQPGTVIDALVLKVLSAELVRIAIANLSIEVFSEVPLVKGQALQLAVSQTPDGIRLAIVKPGEGGAVTGGASPTAGAPRSPETSAAAAARVIDDSVAPHLVAAATPLPKSSISNLEALALNAAAQTAATKQAGMAPLFANLGAAAAGGALPAAVQHAALQLLALRPALDHTLNGDVIKSAFRNSGLFLESSLAQPASPAAAASSSPSAAASPPAGFPDLKAALIIFRQTLATSLSAAPEHVAASTAALPNGTPPVADPFASRPQAGSASAPSPLIAPSSTPDIDVDEVLLPQALLPVAEDLGDTGDAPGAFARAAQVNPGARTAATGTALNLLQEALQGASSGDKALFVDGATLLDALRSGAPRTAPHGDVATTHTNIPPPPFRGAAPAAQAVAPPTFANDAPPAAATQQLLDDTDGAIARQTLLQIASLPDRIDAAVPRTDPAGPRWNFEIPFATPLGTAVAQFEIARDGGDRIVEKGHRIWRARFSLDVEPTGPIHALISLSGETTSVRMWAERPATAAQLRAGSAQLSRALRAAALEPGDIVIGEGAPPQLGSAPAGHFLDRAL